MRVESPRVALHVVLAACAVAAACAGMAENEAFAQVVVDRITYEETHSALGHLTVYFNDTIDTNSIDGSKFRVHYHHSKCVPSWWDPYCDHQDYWLATNFYAPNTVPDLYTISTGCATLTVTNRTITCADHGGTIHAFYKKDHVIELDIDAGGVNSTDNIPIVESKNLPITVLNTRTYFSTATYREGNLAWNVYVGYGGWMDTSSHDPSKLHFRLVNSDSGGVSLAGATITHSDQNGVTMVLDKATNDRMDRLIHPSPGVTRAIQLDIDAGAVKDVYQIPIVKQYNNPVAVFDLKPPAVTSATYYNDTGTILVEFTEPVAINPAQADIAVYNASNPTDLVSLYNWTQNNAIQDTKTANVVGTSTSGNVLTINVTNATKAKISSYGDDRILRMNGAIHDIPKRNVLDPDTEVRLTFFTPPPPPQQPVPVSVPIIPVPRKVLEVATDRTPPGMVSASYDESTSVLSIAFDERVSVDSSGLALRGGSGTLTLGTAPSGYSSQISIPATGIGITNMTLDAKSGAVRDASGNAMPQYSGFPVGLIRPSAPAVVYAEYDPANGLLDVRFDRTVTLGAASLFKVDGVPLDSTEYVEAFFSSYTLSFLLDPELRSAPSTGSVLDVGVGAALDAGKRSLATTNIPISYLKVDVSADDMKLAYSTITGTLYIDIPGERVFVDSYAITVRDSDASYTLNQMDSVLNGVPFSSGGKVLSGDSPIFMDIAAAAIVTNSELMPATRNVPVAIFDGAGIDVVHQSPISNATNLWAAGQGLVLVSTPSRIWVLDAGEPASTKNVTSIPMNGTRVLDMVPMPSTANVAVLTGDSIRLLNLENPTSPRWAGSADTVRNATSGAISYVMVNDLPHVVSVTPDWIMLAYVSDAGVPKAVSSATLSFNPPPGFGAASLDSGMAYTSLRPAMLCSVNLGNGDSYTTSCRGHAGRVGPVAAAAVGDTKLVMSGGTGTVSIRTTDNLRESYSIRTGIAPTAIETVTIYDIPYMLVTAGALSLFDITDEPVLVTTVGSYRSMDVVIGNDGLPYVALLGPDGLSIVDLAGLE